MHYHSSNKYVSETESVEVFILPRIFHLKLQQELVSRRRERSNRSELQLEYDFTTSVAPLFVLHFEA